MALQRNPSVVDAMWEAEWEIASHGYRWIDYQFVDEKTEREHLQKAIEIHREVTGERPQGWYLGRCSPNSHRIVDRLNIIPFNALEHLREQPRLLPREFFLVGRVTAVDEAATNRQAQAQNNADSNNQKCADLQRHTILQAPATTAILARLLTLAQQKDQGS